MLCELPGSFGLQSDALFVVVSLIDQPHEALNVQRVMAEAMDAEPLLRVGARVKAILAF